MTTFKEYIDEKYVAFIDILGFSDLVCRVETEDDFFKINIFNSIMSDYKQGIETGCFKGEKSILKLNFDYNVDVTFVSDCIILSSSNLTMLCSFAGFIQFSFLLSEGLTRGYITKGKICHYPNQNVIFGDAYIRAYKGEKNAIYPRIIIDNNILYEFKNPSIQKALYKDFDGLYCLHYLMKTPFDPEKSVDDSKKFVNSFIKKRKEEFKNNENILKKYLWLENYLNKNFK